MCRGIVGGTRDADDACQEALIKIVRSLPRFDGRSSFSTWSHRVAVNASLDELRKRQRRPALHLAAEHDRPEQPDPTAHQHAVSFPDRLALEAALEQLPDDLRVAVVLRDVVDLDYSEIADTLEIPIGTVKSRISRGRSALAAQLLPESLDDRGNQSVSDERPTDLP